ncbi:MAG: leucine-rich repeat domain-containing protein, partial [Candidatus Azobacteroides sp.]|nr:leucine-rich repeat domain-containing protein [Candidatus Azobacteroides sp.]
MYKQFTMKCATERWRRPLKKYAKSPKGLKFGAMIILLCFCVFTNKAIGQTWDCGNHGAPVSATLSGSGNNCTLTINGSGNMADFNISEGGIPWNTYLSNIKTIVINNGVTNIGNIAFQGCTNLESVTIPLSVTKIGVRAFKDCSSLQTITIPSGVSTIEGEAFINCSHLNAIIINSHTQPLSFESSNYEDNVSTTFGIVDWFKNCSSIQTLYLGRQYTGMAFKGISTLQNLTIGSSVTSIETDAFSDCAINTVTIEDDTVALDFSVYLEPFSNSSIDTLYLGRNINSGFFDYPCPFQKDSTLKSVTIGNDVTVINSNSFYKCTGLQSLTLGNALTSIGESAFYGCSSLTGLSIPNSVTSIGSEAFSGCSNLKTVTIEDGTVALDFTSM